MGDPVPGPLDILTLWFRYPDLTDEELKELKKRVEGLEHWQTRKSGARGGGEGGEMSE